MSSISYCGFSIRYSETNVVASVTLPPLRLDPADSSNFLRVLLRLLQALQGLRPEVTDQTGSGRTVWPPAACQASGDPKHTGRRSSRRLVFRRTRVYFIFGSCHRLQSPLNTRPVIMAAQRPVEVYLDLLSQPCRAVHVLLDCGNIPHTVRPVALRRGENRTPDFTKLNPMQKVPVMVDNGFVLTESDAIMKYLATKYDVQDHWYPRQPERRARVDEYTAWHHTNTRAHAAKVFILEVLLPTQSGSPVDKMHLNHALSQLDDTLDKLESMFLRRQPFLCGDDITVADLLAICELMQPLGGGRDVLQQRPQLQRWRSRVQSAVGESFDRAHAVLYALRDRRKAKL